MRELNFHPIFASFPFAILTIAVLFQALYIYSKKQGFSDASDYLIWTICLITPLTYYSGYYGLGLLDQKVLTNNLNFITNHQSFARLFLFSLIPTLVFSLIKDSAKITNKAPIYLYRVFMLLNLLLASYVSFLGGSLVFEHAVGVLYK